MISLIRNFVLATLCVLSLLVAATPSHVAALDCANPQTTQEELQCGACHTNGSTATQCGNAAAESTNTINQTIVNIVNLISIVAGIIAVIMLVVGGARYVTSSGNEQKVSAAKNTVLFAIIGLIIIAMAQIFVKYVLSHITHK